MSKPLFCILGASASGKSTLVQMLEKEFNMKQIPSYTTRSPRYEGEAGHTFVSEKEFKALNDIVAYNYYLDNHYGITASQIDDDTYDLYVVDQTGLNELHKKYKGNRKIYSIFIDCSYINRYKRLFGRYHKMYKNFEKALKETSKRTERDKIEFKNCKSSVDYVINNDENINTAYKNLRKYVVGLTTKQEGDNDIETEHN
jgi:guanylate kinase